MRHFVFIAIVFLCAHTELWAQPHYRCVTFGTEQGLHTEGIQQIIQDGSGRLWMATFDGIICFDGHNFKSYRPAGPGNGTTQSKRFTKIAEDHLGMIWGCCYNDLLYRLNPSDGSFLAVDTNGKAVKDIFKTSGQRLILKSSDSQLQVVDVFRNGAISNVTDLVPNPVPDGVEVHSVVEDKYGRTWILSGAGLYCDGKLIYDQEVFCSAENDKVLLFGCSGGRILNIGPEGAACISTMLKDDITHIQMVPKSTLMILVSSLGVISSFDISTGTQKLLFGEHPSLEWDTFCGVDNTGNVWLVPGASGLYWFDRQRCELVQVPGRDDRHQWNIENRISAFLPDSQGNLWVGSSWNGLERLSSNNDAFYLTDLLRGGSISPQSSVRACLEDSDGVFWVGTKDGRVRLYNHNLKEIGVFCLDGRVKAGGTDNFGMVYCISEGHDGTIWIGTKGNGFYAAEPWSGRRRLTHYSFVKNVYSLYEDSSHKLWIASLDKGLRCMDLDSPDRRILSGGDGLEIPAECDAPARFVTCGPDGHIYVTGTRGVIVSDGAVGSQECLSFSKLDVISEDTDVSDCHGLLFDNDGNIIICTNGSGLQIHKADNTAPSRINARNERLISDTILGAVTDGDGNIWTVSKGGLNKINNQTGLITSFPYDRFATPLLFNEGMPQCASDGRIIVNTSSGLLSFNPAEISHSGFVPEIIFNSLTKSGISGHQERLIIGDDVPSAVKLRRYDRLSMEFSAVDLTAPEQIGYFAKIEGRDSSWTNIGDVGVLSVGPMRRGNYKLMVRSTNCDGMAVDNTKSFDITVMPPFWASKWMMAALILLLVGGVVVMLLRRRLAAIKAEDPYLRGISGSGLEFAERLVACLRANLDNAELNVEMVAGSMNVSRSVLFSKTKEVFGETPNELLLAIRFDKCKELMSREDLTIAQIAYMTGFNDPHYFSRTFKRHFGVTPTDFRQNITQISSQHH